MPVMNRRAALIDASYGGTGKYGGMISSYGGPQMQTSLGGMQGEGLLDWLKKAHSFVKDNKLISRGAKALNNAGLPFAGTVGNVAETLGYGLKSQSSSKPRKKRQSGGNSYGINGGKKKGSDTLRFVDLFNDYESLDIAEVDTLTVVDQLTILAPTNQIVFGDAPNQVTLNVNTGSNSTINIPTIAPSLVADVVLTDQDINGNKRFNDTTTTNTLLSTDITSINGTITTLNSTTGNIGNLTSTTGTINNLSSQTINATTSITTPLLIVPSISVSNITANTGNIDTLTTVTTNANTVNADGNIGTLSATNGNFSTLFSPTGTINNLTSQTINATTSTTSPTIYANNILSILPNQNIYHNNNSSYFVITYNLFAKLVNSDTVSCNVQLNVNDIYRRDGLLPFTIHTDTNIAGNTIITGGLDVTGTSLFHNEIEVQANLQVDNSHSLYVSNIRPYGSDTTITVYGGISFNNSTPSYVPASLNYYEVQTYSVTWSFGTPTSTKTVKVVRTGSLVVITYEGPQFTVGGTSGGWNAIAPNFLPTRFMPSFDSGNHNLQSGYYNSGTAPFRFQCRAYLTSTGGLTINSTSGGSVSANDGAVVRFDPGSIVYCI